MEATGKTKILWTLRLQIVCSARESLFLCLVGMKESLWHMVDVLLRRLKIYVP